MAEKPSYLGGRNELDISYPTEFFGVLGFYIVVIGLVSYTAKERLFVSNALIAIGIGIAAGPIGLNWISVDRWTDGSDDLSNKIVYQVTRVALGIQVLFTGISLPKAYLKKSWKSLTILLLPVMTVAWFVSALFIWAFIPGITFVESLVIGACITPTDPILSASVVRGRFAEKYVAKHVRNLIAAESGANDGLGFPFIYLAMYLIVRHATNHTLGWAIKTWLVQEILYDILISVAMGAIIGYLARKTLKYAEANRMIDHESFLSYGVGLAFFTLGVVGIIGSDDILACFIAGNSFTWDDWRVSFLSSFAEVKLVVHAEFELKRARQETEDHSFQDVIDGLIDSAIFIFIGTLIPWNTYTAEQDLQPWRVVVIGILVLLFRRLPCVLLVYRWVPDIEDLKEALFTGWFGPIGVGAIYYVQVALRELPDERERLRGVVAPVVYFIVLCSVIIHGITIPTFKLQTHLYSRTKSLGSRSTTQTQASDTPPDGRTTPARKAAITVLSAAPLQQGQVSATKTSQDPKPVDSQPDDAQVSRTPLDSHHETNNGIATPQRVAFT